MTPKQALDNLANVAANTNTTLANHQILQQSIAVLGQLISVGETVGTDIVGATKPGINDSKQTFKQVE